MVTPLKSWFEEFLKTNHKKLIHIEIISSWDQIVGKNIASFTKAKTIYRNTLMVEVKEKEWQIELFYYVGDILIKYKKLFIDLPFEKIYFIYNPNLLKELNTSYYKKKIKKKSILPSTCEKKKNHSSTENSITIQESLIRLKKTWKSIKEIRKNNVCIPIKNLKNKQGIKKKTFSKIERLYSVNKISSEFLNSQDEFQPFDLY